MKYTRLTKEQFEELHQEFINFLATQSITADEWLKLKEDKPEVIEEIATKLEPKIIYEFGYNLNDYKVINDTIKKGESFGVILDRHHVDYPVINKINSSNVSFIF